MEKFQCFKSCGGVNLEEMSLNILPRELLEMIALHLDVSSTIAISKCSLDFFNITTKMINWNLLLQKMFPQGVREDFESLGREVVEVVEYYVNRSC